MTDAHIAGRSAEFELPNRSSSNENIKSKIATVAFALAGTFTASASHAQDTTPSVVIVHGTFADGSDWAKVVPLLQAQGVAVTVVQNPLTSLADDVAATRRALNNQQGKVVLVGHSWGGTVITEAGSDPKVSALVYVAAFAPEAGQTSGEQGKGAPTPPWHQSCSAKMGRDTISVVDHQLRLYGIDKLRIADASIMLRITASQHSPQSVCGQSSSGTSLKSPPSTPSISYCVR